MRLAWALALVLFAFAPSFARAAESNLKTTNIPPARGAGANFRGVAYDEGMKAAPGLMAAARIKCEIRQALDVGDATLFDENGKRAGTGELYEVACADGFGYLITAQRSLPPSVIDCIAVASTDRVACMLPLNRHPAAALEPYLAAAGQSCRPLRARLVGMDQKSMIRRYEAQCASGGYIVDLPLPDGSGGSPVVAGCMAADNICRLTSHRDNVAALATKVGRVLADKCDITDARWVGTIAAHGTDLYEVACRTGQEGQLIELSPSGVPKGSQPCTRVKLVGASCELKTADDVDPLIAMAEAGNASSSASGSPTVIIRPDWISRPDGNAVTQVFPEKAQRLHVSGQATIVCRVTMQGSVRDCFVTDESPAQFGFGPAALKLSGFFKMRPLSINGQPVDGATVSIPIIFSFAR